MPDNHDEELVPDSPAGMSPVDDQEELSALIRDIVDHNDSTAIARFFNLVMDDIRQAVRPYAMINQARDVTQAELVSVAAEWFLINLHKYDAARAQVRTWVRQYSRFAVQHAHPEWNSNSARHRRNGGYITDLQQVADPHALSTTADEVQGGLSIFDDTTDQKHVVEGVIERSAVEQYDNQQLVAAIEAFPVKSRDDRFCVRYILASLTVLKREMKDTCENIANEMKVSTGTAWRLKHLCTKSFYACMAAHLQAMGFTLDVWGGR